ncbi:hypothetical protein B0H16DRAFT_1757996 [Mycena metata]|uniref:Uncharacterized protein n=1 Tax=Mycena metata TaxID=1033252 RepID=A0AAD7ICZ7_9AGAR|nr:hypothetical protein B0H16DRAFT_1757996 [Mycena metata]
MLLAVWEQECLQSEPEWDRTRSAMVPGMVQGSRAAPRANSCPRWSGQLGETLPGACNDRQALTLDGRTTVGVGRKGRHTYWRAVKAIGTSHIHRWFIFARTTKHKGKHGIESEESHHARHPTRGLSWATMPAHHKRVKGRATTALDTVTVVLGSIQLVACSTIPASSKIQREFWGFWKEVKTSQGLCEYDSGTMFSAYRSPHKIHETPIRSTARRRDAEFRSNLSQIPRQTQVSKSRSEDFN